MQGAMHAQILKTAGCLIWTQLWSAETDNKNKEFADECNYVIFQLQYFVHPLVWIPKIQPWLESTEIHPKARELGHGWEGLPAQLQPGLYYIHTHVAWMVFLRPRH